MDVQYIESKLTRRPHSPMFARLASEYLASGKIDEALELCTSGLERFPRYSTAHLVRAKCLAAKADYVSALVNLHNALSVFPDSVALRKYETEWKEKAVQQNVVQTTEEVTVPPEPLPNPPVELVVQPVVPEIPAPPVSDFPLEISVDNLPAVIEVPKLPEVVAEQPVPVVIEKLPELKEEFVPPAVSHPVARKVVPAKIAEEGERIVSKTLAEIYATQGEFEEAILTYQLLKQQRPQNVTEFERRIKELELKLQAKQA